MIGNEKIVNIKEKAMNSKEKILNSKVYICGKEVEGKKMVYFALQVVYGIGQTRAKYICEDLKQRFEVNPTDYIGNLTDKIVQYINESITEEFLVEGDLKKQVDQNIDAKIRIQCREGKRHKAHLPLHGRTRSNGRTAKRRRAK